MNNYSHNNNHNNNIYTVSDDDNETANESDMDTASISETESETESEYESEIDNNRSISIITISDRLIDNKFCLLIPELYNKFIHGKTEDSDPDIDSHYIVLQTFNFNTDSNNSNRNSSISNLFKHINEMCKFYKIYYRRNFYNLSLGNRSIRNYNCMIKNSSYLDMEIGQIYYLKGGECVCIIKTFWIKIIQRAWKKIYQMRKKIYQLRNRPDSIMYRQLTGTWLDKYRYMPSIRGMLLADI